MVGEDLDPLPRACNPQGGPRRSGMEQSCVQVFLLTLHLILIREGMIFHSTHLDPIPLQPSDGPGEAFGFVLVHEPFPLLSLSRRTSAVCDHWCDHPCAPGNTHCNRPVGPPLAEMAPARRCHTGHR